MNFAEARRSKGWIVLLATVVGISLGAYSFISKSISNHVYTVTCGIVDYKPGVFFKTCADGGIAVGQIEWESWTKGGAEGKGIYAINNCLPDCASGKLLKANVTVKLTGEDPLVEVRGKKVLNRITIATANKKPLPLGTSNTDSWVLE
jgi:hypothetical protein